MSDSRLEKFIYAICSMDVSDLPVPLSRIEKLWNCLITGETPDFEPLSRNEKYLMAMLDRYDISNLPAPMSRGEKLLYKIAVGETDLSDVPGYLSRYEELLKYLIENGGIGGGDFEYVLHTINQSLYTLYTTAEKPVKSAILSGNTLINSNNGVNSTKFYINSKSDFNRSERLIRKTDKTLIKPSTRYLLTLKVSELNLDGLSQVILYINNDTTDLLFPNAKDFVITANGSYKQIVTTNVANNFNNHTFVIKGKASEWEQTDSTSRTLTISDIMLIEYQEGMENWDIPYFEGMKSVKMPVLTTTGENICPPLELGNFSNLTGEDWDSNEMLRSKIIKVKPLTNYTLSNNLSYSYKIIEMDSNYNVIKYAESSSITTTNNTMYIRVKTGAGQNDINVQYKIEQGTQATTYEPFKSNILTTPEEVILRSLPNGVCDTLNVETGEYVQRIGEKIFNGSETWQESGNIAPNHYCAFTRVEGSKNELSYNIVNNSLPVRNILSQKIDYEGCMFNGWTSGDRANVVVKIANSKLSSTSVEGIKAYLQSNPLIVQYELAEPVIKTVDLTTVDQDNQPTQLGTFENITHVSLESSGLIPTLEMEVATNLLEDTVFNLTDAFNTLYPTAAKPVVDGKLYGQTLVNLATENGVQFTTSSDWKHLKIKQKMLNTTKKYMVKFNSSHDYKGYVHLRDITTNTYITDGSRNNFKEGSNVVLLSGFLESDLESFSNIRITFFSDSGSATNLTIADVMLIEYQDGMENWDIPYFTGMQSIQAPGMTMTNDDGTKSITLSTPSDLELRKVGAVQDEVNVMTGEVVEKIEEITFNSSNGWALNNTTFNSVYEFRYTLNKKGVDFIVKSNNFIQGNNGDYERINIYNNYIYLCINKSRLAAYSIDELNTYLQSNPLTIQYELKTPITKTVDLTIVNQDGNETKLRTFDDTTHVLLQSEAGPNPSASLTVRTKIPSGSSTNLLMDELSTEQQQLSDTVDEQSNNVDATMIATTEIFEETL